MCACYYFGCHATWLSANGKLKTKEQVFMSHYAYASQVVGTACADRTQEIQNANLFDLDSKYADVVTEESAINALKAGWS
jgi:hypothetical protein